MNILSVLKYRKFFSAGKFIYFVTHIGKSLSFIRQAVVLYYCVRDPETPKYIKALIMGALGYLILPADAMPDIIAGLGWVDDVAVLSMVMKYVEDYIKPSHEEAARKRFPFGREKA